MTTPKIRRSQVAGMNIHYVNYSLDYFLDAQQRCGFTTIELWCAAPHVWIDHMHYYDAREIAEKIRRRNLTVACVTPENCTYPYQFAAKEEDHRLRSQGYFENGIRLAAELECPRMEVNSGWGYWNEDADEAWKRSVEMLTHLADFAAERGVELVMESVRPEESQLVIDLPSNQRMIAEVGRENLKPMVDTCAMGVAGETLEQWYAAYDGKIAHMHFIDGNPYGHLIWGDGNHHLGKFIEVLNKYGYEGYLGQEITDGRYYDDPMKADLRNMRNFERYMDD